MAEPKIRFQEFFDEWKTVEFGRITSEFTDKTKVENETVLLSSAIDGMYLNSELFGHQRGSSTIGYRKIKRGTLILSAQNLHLGNANVNLRFEEGMISPAYKTYDIVGDCSVEFMAHWIKRESTKQFFLDATTPGASECRRNVDWKALYSSEIYLPSKREQDKIVECLNFVDDVITLLTEEYRLWEEKKKGIMQKIFSQEIRFKDENGSDYPEWEEKMFSEVFLILGNNTLSRAELNYENGNVRNVHYGDILTKFGAFVDVKVDTLPYITKIENAEKAMRHSLKSGDIVIADTAEDETVGKMTEIINADNINIVAGLHTIPCRPVKGMFAEKYLGYYMNSYAYHSQLYPLIQGIKVSSISKSAIQDTLIKIPCLAEQQKIADCLSSIDEVIAIKKQKLDTWKNIKKGLLQQMFV